MTNARYSVSIESVVVNTDVNASDPIDYGDFATGMVLVPDGSAMMSLTWYVSTAIDGSYIPANDATGSAVTQTVAAGEANPIPVALAGARFLKILGDEDGVVSVTLKD